MGLFLPATVWSSACRASAFERADRNIGFMVTGHLLPDLPRSLFSNHLLADPGAGIATRSIRCPRRACRRSRRAIETSTRMPPAERGREVRLDRRQREVDDRAFDEREAGAEDRRDKHPRLVPLRA